MAFISGGHKSAAAFTDAFKTGFAIGQTKKKERKEDALSEAYSLMDEVGEKSVVSDDILGADGKPISAIPVQTQQMSAIAAQDADPYEGISQQQQMLQAQAGEDFDKPEYKTTYAGAISRKQKARELLRKAKVGGKDQSEYFKEFTKKTQDTAFKLRDASAQAWVTGNYDRAAALAEQSYSFIEDGADANVRFVPTGKTREDGSEVMAMAVSFTDSTNGTANQAEPILVESPEKMMSMLGRAIDYNTQLGNDRSEQVIALADSLENRQIVRQKHEIGMDVKNYRLNKRKFEEVDLKNLDIRQDELKLSQDANVRAWDNEKRLDLKSYHEAMANKRADVALDMEQDKLRLNWMDKYMTHKDNRIKYASNLMKAATSGVSNGHGKTATSATSALMKLDDAMSKRINDLYDKSGQVDEAYMMQTKSTASAFAMVNAGRTPNELAQAAVGYTDLQAQSRAQAEEQVKDSPEMHAAMKEHNGKVPDAVYRNLVRKQTLANMAPHHEKLADGKTYYVTDGGAYLVPERYISGNRSVNTFYDAYSQAMAEIDSDPEMQQFSKAAGFSGEPNGVRATASASSTGGTTNTPGMGNYQTPGGRPGVVIPKPKTDTPAPAPAAIPAPNISAQGIADKGVTRGGAIPTDNDPLNRGMLPVKPTTARGARKDPNYVPPAEAKRLNESLRKVRVFAVRGNVAANKRGEKVEKPTPQDIRNAIKHPGTTPSEKRALEVLMKKAVIQGDTRTGKKRRVKDSYSLR